MTSRLARHQHPDGYWDGDWPHQQASGAAANDNAEVLTNRLLATGHAMEWWALAPRRVHPPRPVLASAGQWLARTIDSLTEEQIQANYTYLTHAGRALALWRGKTPAQAMKSATN